MTGVQHLASTRVEHTATEEDADGHEHMAGDNLDALELGRRDHGRCSMFKPGKDGAGWNDMNTKAYEAASWAWFGPQASTHLHVVQGLAMCHGGTLDGR